MQMRSAMCRSATFLLLLVCFSFSVLSVNGRAAKDSVIFPDGVYSRLYQGKSVTNSQTVLRPLRQINRRPTGNTRQTNGDDEDIFGGFDTNWNNNNNGQQNSGNRPNGQWSNNGRPNQGSGNRPNGQWSNNGRPNQGSGNRPNGQWSNNGQPNQGSQGLGNRPNGEWSNNGNQNPGSQGFGTNPTDQWSNNGNQNPGSQGFGTNPTDQWSNNGNQNQGGSNWNSQNGGQQSSSSSSSQGNQPDTDACNRQCRERVTGEYNPVCGTDAMTYQNRRFLECISDCGIQTSLSYNGKCITTTERIPVR